MTKQEAIKFMLNNPYKKVTHRFFTSDEYLYSKGDHIIYDENGYVFEDFSGDMLSACGMYIRNSANWQTDWSIKE